jgi:hypothetical protein
LKAMDAIVLRERAEDSIFCCVQHPPGKRLVNIFGVVGMLDIKNRLEEKDWHRVFDFMSSIRNAAHVVCDGAIGRTKREGGKWT